MIAKSPGGEKVFAVMGDTHIPDRIDCLHPELLGLLAEIGPDQILVTGDISKRSVLDDLAQIAPVHAARGNRDWNWSPALPMEIIVEAFGVKLMLLHGHGGWGHYFLDKADHTVRGYRLERYRKYFTQKYSDADGYIFGHSHSPENTTIEGKLFFNPGSACLGGKVDIPPSFGVLRIDSSGTMEGRIIPLGGYKIINKKWAAMD